MTKHELWEAYCKKNPSFLREGDSVRISVAGLKKLFDQTWHYGYENGKESVPTGKQTPPKPNVDMPDFFKDIFGRFKN